LDLLLSGRSKVNAGVIFCRPITGGAFMSKNKKTVTTQALIEGLEERRMLSATLSHTGFLTVTGTSRGDVISVSKRHSTLSVKVNGQTTTFSVSKVKHMVVSSRRGNDKITGA